MTSKLLIIAGLGIGYYLFVKVPHKEVKYLPKKFAGRKQIIPKKTLSISTVVNQPIIKPIDLTKDILKLETSDDPIDVLTASSMGSSKVSSIDALILMKNEKKAREDAQIAIEIAKKEAERQVWLNTVEAINRQQRLEKRRQAEITRVTAIRSTGIIPKAVTTNLASLEAELAREKTKLAVATGGTWTALKRLVNDLNRRIKIIKRGY